MEREKLPETSRGTDPNVQGDKNKNDTYCILYYRSENIKSYYIISILSVRNVNLYKTILITLSFRYYNIRKIYSHITYV